MTSSRALSLVMAIAFAACFSPDYPTDLPCGPDGYCPPGQSCSVDNICLAATGGGGDADPDSPDARRGPDARTGLGNLQSIDIGPDLMLTLAETHTFVLTATYEGGTQIEDNLAVIWRSSDNGIVFVDFMGIARPQTVGTATVTADFDGRLGTAEVTINP